MKRFRVRPYRADAGYLFWSIGPDCGRIGKLRVIHLGHTPGECIDRLLGRHGKKRRSKLVENVSVYHKPSYPEH